MGGERPSMRGCSRPLKVLFFGTDEFALHTLKRLHGVQGLQSHSRGQPAIDKLEVVCPPDKRRSRNKVSMVPVKEYAHNHGLRWHDTPAGASQLSSWTCPSGFDIGVVVSFGYFLTTNVLDELPLGAINVHPSLLPKYRGAAPIQWALLNGDTETGVSIIDVHRKNFDCGDIFWQEAAQIDRRDTYTTLMDQLGIRGAQGVMDVLSNHDELCSTALPQQSSESSRAPKIKKDQGNLHWSKSGIEAVYNAWRALGSSTGVWLKCSFDPVSSSKEPQEVLLRLVDIEPPAHLPNLPEGADAGEIIYCKRSKRIYIRSSASSSVRTEDGVEEKGQNLWLPCLSLQPHGKRAISAADFANGFQLNSRDRQSRLPLRRLRAL